MRGTVAKKIRRFAEADTPDLPSSVVYTTIITGQDWKRRAGVTPNYTTVLDQCTRQYYKLLKKIWKM